ncbi:hypothetical protein ONE63_000014 [Megalurothrips usitatus]|uniref:Uncharacterized protein n=1 Tax=Megalurothrips usitatus TaxID=439358 RepID=A0AAV7Y3B9_9NEOP|nr:hypothetical protein ONE63_000014 [Megalurothrips usitatus]
MCVRFKLQRFVTLSKQTTLDFGYVVDLHLKLTYNPGSMELLDAFGRISSSPASCVTEVNRGWWDDITEAADLLSIRRNVASSDGNGPISEGIVLAPNSGKEHVKKCGRVRRASAMVHLGTGKKTPDMRGKHRQKQGRLMVKTDCTGQDLNGFLT